MVIKFKIKKNYFQDALRLMRVSKNLSELEGVNKAVVVMATEKAKFALADAGLMTPEISEASGSDLVMVVEAATDDIASGVLLKMEELTSAGLVESAKKGTEILNQEIQVINIGLERFKDALEAQGVKVAHVNWQPPAGGDMKLIDILKKMY